MLRILLIIVILALLIGIIKRVMSPKVGKKEVKTELERAKMVKCAYCELYVAFDEALRSNNQYFCSIEHQTLEAKKSER